MVRILVGGVVAGVVVFFWGFVSHMLLPLGEMGLQSLAHEDDLNAAIKKDVRRAGAVLCAGQGHEQVTIARRDGRSRRQNRQGPIRIHGDLPQRP